MGAHRDTDSAVALGLEGTTSSASHASAGTSLQHSSINNDWQTPPHVVDAVHLLFGGIALDPCAPVENNTRAKHFYTRQGATLPWCDRTYVNPPYDQFNAFVRKLRYEATFGHRMMLLLSAARFETRRFQTDVLNRNLSAIFFFRKKLAFIRPGHKSRPFLASIAYFYNTDIHCIRLAFGELGKAFG